MNFTRYLKEKQIAFENIFVFKIKQSNSQGCLKKSQCRLQQVNEYFLVQEESLKKVEVDF